MPFRSTLLLFSILWSARMFAQDNGSDSPNSISSKYILGVQTIAGTLDQKLDKRSEKIIARFLKEEKKISHKLARKDSLAAKAVFGDAGQQYDNLNKKLQKANLLKQYIPSLDTFSTSLKFLEANPQLFSVAKNGPLQLKTAMEKVNKLQSQFQKAEEIKKFLKERKQYLKDQLSKLGFGKELKKLNKEVYYYSAQVQEYKQLLKDHKKAEKKAIELLSKTQLFKDFMSKNSMLASVFRMPGSDPGALGSQANLAGLQTRAQVNGLIQQQIAAGGANAQGQLRQNLQEAQGKLKELKGKLDQLGNSGNKEPGMPEGFKPNNQRTKNFWGRIELGANMQSQKSNGYFPVTSDIGLSAGYKLNDKSVIGLGMSYKMGWGESIRNIKITHQGIGLRSFIEWKLKGSFWVAGGYELNFRNKIQYIEQLKDRSAWQESGLIGLSKIVDMRSKLLKKTKVQLLWDFLSYKQAPKTAAMLFRVGYSF